MYRRCCICGWGRKECLEKVKFFNIPHEADLRRLRWMEVLAGVRPDGFKKVDSVCSIHFVSGKPSRIQQNVDFVPTLYLKADSIPEKVRFTCLRDYTPEAPEVVEARRIRLETLKARLNEAKQRKNDDPDDWREKKRQRLETQRQMGEEPTGYYWPAPSGEQKETEYVEEEGEEEVEEEEVYEEIIVDEESLLLEEEYLPRYRVTTAAVHRGYDPRSYGEYDNFV